MELAKFFVGCAGMFLVVLRRRDVDRRLLAGTLVGRDLVGARRCLAIVLRLGRGIVHRHALHGDGTVLSMALRQRDTGHTEQRKIASMRIHLRTLIF